MKDETVFLIFAVLAGIAVLVLTPPFQVPDEDKHFFRIYQVAEGQWVAERHDDRIGGDLPASLGDVAGTFRHIRFKPEQKVDRATLEQAYGIDLEPDARKRLWFEYVARYHPVSYLPQLVGVAPARLLGASPLVTMYLGRIAAFVSWLLIIYFAVRTIPFYKSLVVLLALTPMSVFQAASLSADSFLNGTSTLYIAFLFRLRYGDSRVDLKSLLLLLGLSIVIVLSKGAYFPLLLLLLLIPSSKFPSKQHRWIAVTSIVFLCLALAYSWGQQVKEFVVPIPRRDSDPVQQMEFIRNDLIGFAGILVRSTVTQLEVMATSYIGVLGWMDTKLSSVLVVCFALAIVAVALLSPRRGASIGPGVRCLCLAIAIAIYVIILAGNYITWNPVGSDIAGGMQGRYFIPLSVLPFVVALNGYAPFKKRSGWIKPLVAVTASFALVETGVALYTRYYG